MCENLYLVHYGKKGMHWGEWNEETRRKYMGSVRRGLSAATPPYNGSSSVSSFPDVSSDIRSAGKFVKTTAPRVVSAVKAGGKKGLAVAKSASKEHAKKQVLDGLRNGNLTKIKRNMRKLNSNDMEELLRVVRSEKALLQEAVGSSQQQKSLRAEFGDKTARKALDRVGNKLSETAGEAIGTGVAQVVTEVALAKMSGTPIRKVDKKEAFKKGATASLKRTESSNLRTPNEPKAKSQQEQPQQSEAKSQEGQQEQPETKPQTKAQAQVVFGSQTPKTRRERKLFRKKTEEKIKQSKKIS